MAGNNGKRRCAPTEEELEDRRLENVQPTSWDDDWIVTLNISDNVVGDKDASSPSTFTTDSPKSVDEASASATGTDDAEETDNENEGEGEEDVTDDAEEETDDDDDDDEADYDHGEDLKPGKKRKLPKTDGKASKN